MAGRTHDIYLKSLQQHVAYTVVEPTDTIDSLVRSTSVHTAEIERLTEQAKKFGKVHVVWDFFPHQAMKSALFELQCPPSKLKWVRAWRFRLAGQVRTAMLCYYKGDRRFDAVIEGCLIKAVQHPPSIPQDGSCTWKFKVPVYRNGSITQDVDATVRVDRSQAAKGKIAPWSAELKVNKIQVPAFWKEETGTLHTVPSLEVVDLDQNVPKVSASDVFVSDYDSETAPKCLRAFYFTAQGYPHSVAVLSSRAVYVDGKKLPTPMSGGSLSFEVQTMNGRKLKAELKQASNAGGGGGWFIPNALVPSGLQLQVEGQDVPPSSIPESDCVPLYSPEVLNPAKNSPTSAVAAPKGTYFRTVEVFNFLTMGQLRSISISHWASKWHFMLDGKFIEQDRVHQKRFNDEVKSLEFPVQVTGRAEGAMQASVRMEFSRKRAGWRYACSVGGVQIPSSWSLFQTPAKAPISLAPPETSEVSVLWLNELSDFFDSHETRRPVVQMTPSSGWKEQEPYFTPKPLEVVDVEDTRKSNPPPVPQLQQQPAPVPALEDNPVAEGPPVDTNENFMAVAPVTNETNEQAATRTRPRRTSAGLAPPFRSERNLEYFSFSNQKWCAAVAKKGFDTGLTDVTLGRSAQMRRRIHMCSLRQPLQSGEPVEVYEEKQAKWWPAEVSEGRPGGIAGYMVKFGGGRDDEHYDSHHVRRRFPANRTIYVYRPAQGWEKGTVSASSGDGTGKREVKDKVDVTPELTEESGDIKLFSATRGQGEEVYLWTFVDIKLDSGSTETAPSYMLHFEETHESTSPQEASAA
mmetsp:Transcript_31194/g.56990  ORF Transcript_31194/g.56990 Transcript_31194/m.56990 type:complete len:800 (+) Transcript_31194:96-2495(+)